MEIGGLKQMIEDRNGLRRAGNEGLGWTEYPVHALNKRKCYTCPARGPATWVVLFHSNGLHWPYGQDAWSSSSEWAGLGESVLLVLSVPGDSGRGLWIIWPPLLGTGIPAASRGKGRKLESWEMCQNVRASVPLRMWHGLVCVARRDGSL